jgi:hypothetical protein
MFPSVVFILLSKTGGRIRLVKKSEKHRATRHRGATPVELKDGKGITRDFSSTGIFFETDKSFTQGQPINFTIVLENVDPDRPVRVKCRGEIVRVEESGQKIGVAVAISSYNFERLRYPEKKLREGRKPKGGSTAKK